MDYLFYSLFGGIWPFIIIVGYIYLWVKISRLNKRIDTLENHGEKQVGTMLSSDDTARSITQESSSIVGVTPSPAPVPAPMIAEEDTETKEEKSARWLGWVGGVMLILGVSFFMKYAFDHWIGPMGQVAIGIVGGLAIIGLGQKLRVKYLNYSDILLGVGIGILYLAVYAGYEFYDPAVIAQPLAFALMILVTTLAMVIAVLGNTKGIAVIGVLGGFLTPVLLSTGENHLVTLSLYMIVLNIGVLGVSWFTKWTKLNYLAFFGTIILFGGWMDAHYWRDPDNQLTLTFFFLTIFFLIFLTNSILHHFTRKEPSRASDLILIAFNAMGYFGACYSILERNHSDYLGFFALLLAVVYLAVAYVAYSSNKHDRTLNLTLPGIAVVFVSIAIPLQLSDYWISIAWLVESVVLIYVGLMIKERPIQVFGWILLLLGMVSMMSEVGNIRSTGSNITDGLPAFANMGFFLLMLGVAVLYAIGMLYYRAGDATGETKKVLAIMLVLANILTIHAVTSEIKYLYNKKIDVTYQVASDADRNQGSYRLEEIGNNQNEAYAKVQSLRNQSNTITSIFWAIYATLLLVIGFMRRIRVLRIFGLVFFFITAIRVLIEVGALGPLYRIISTMAFGAIAVAAAFLYAKYKHRIKEIIYD